MRDPKYKNMRQPPLTCNDTYRRVLVEKQKLTDKVKKLERENQNLKDEIYDLTAKFKALLALEAENERLATRSAELEVELDGIEMKHRVEMRKEYRRNKGLHQRLNEATAKWIKLATGVDPRDEECTS